MTDNKFSEKDAAFKFIKSFLIDLGIIVVVILGIHFLCLSIEWLYNAFPLEPDITPIKTYFSINLTRSIVTITDLVSIMIICIIGIMNIFKFTWLYIESFVAYWRFICKRCKENSLT